MEPAQWFRYGGERSGRFQNLSNKDGSAKTECGIHTEISTSDLNMNLNANTLDAAAVAVASSVATNHIVNADASINTSVNATSVV